MATKRWAKGLALMLVFVLAMSITAYGNTSTKQEILGGISAENIMEHISLLSPGDNARMAGTAGERAAAEYIAEKFAEYDLADVVMPSFDTVVFYDKGASIEIKNSDGTEYTVRKPLNLEYTKSGAIAEKEVVYVGLGGPNDCAAATGKIALIKRGEYYFSEKVKNAFAAGALGVILFNNTTDDYIHGTLGSESDIPAIEIHPLDGEMLVELLQSGAQITVSMSASGEIKDVTSQNVIGNLYAKQQKNNTPTIVIGAHYDCVDTPGANDNASGTATMLEIARVLSLSRYNANFKFIAFGAEEVGLVGAYNFVENLSKTEGKKIAAMINMDMVGVGDKVGVWTIGDKASKVLSNLAVTYVRKMNLDLVIGDDEDRSDHAAFAENGIPAVYLSYEVDENYHTDLDIVDNIDPENVENIAKIVAEMAVDMAEKPMLQSTQGFNGVVNKQKQVNPSKSMK